MPTLRPDPVVLGLMLLCCVGCPVAPRGPADGSCSSDDECSDCTDCLNSEVCRCDDGIDCTMDICVRGTCVFTPDDALCDDGVECTIDVCGDEGCTNTPDNALCTDEFTICLGPLPDLYAEGDQEALCVGCCDPCIARCPGLGGCPPLEEFPGFEDARADLIERVQDLDCASDFPFAVAGRCADGTRFLYELLDLFSLVGYFDENTGAYFAFQTTSDVVIPPCNGVFYGPTRFSCEGATVTEVLCGNAFDVGDMIDSLE